MAENLIEGIKKTKIIAPPTDCISPIGEQLLEKGLRKEINAEFYCSVTRKPSVYRGNPFVIEAGIAYGGSLDKEGLSLVMRFANKVPLLYQAGGCGVTKGVLETAWRNYGLSQSRGALPAGPLVIFVHIASVWVPFTSESKEAVAHYPEILKDIKLALQECGRKLGIHIRKKKAIAYEAKKKGYIEKYLPHLADGLQEVCELTDAKTKEVKKLLEAILEETRK